MTTLKISAVDLFCGVGGLTHGLIQAGIDVRLGVDLDPASKYPYEQNNGAKFLLADVLALHPAQVAKHFLPGAVTLLAGCAPCQPFSTYAQNAHVAKRNKSTPGSTPRDQWKLVECFGELIEKLQPDLITMENVPPLSRAPVFGNFINKLRNYWITWSVIDCTTIGLPQTRKRLVMVGSRLGPIEFPEFDRPRTTVRDAISDLSSLRAGEIDPNDRMHQASKLSTLNMKRIKASKPGGTWRDWPSSLRAPCHKRDTGVTYPGVYGRMEWDKPSPTITTQCFGYGNGRFGHPEQDRAISLREAAMLQGFPRGYLFLPPTEPVRFSVLGRLIGNAVPVTLGTAIGNVLMEHAIHYVGSGGSRS